MSSVSPAPSSPSWAPSPSCTEVAADPASATSYATGTASSGSSSTYAGTTNNGPTGPTASTSSSSSATPSTLTTSAVTSSDTDSQTGSAAQGPTTAPSSPTTAPSSPTTTTPAYTPSSTSDVYTSTPSYSDSTFSSADPTVSVSSFATVVTTAPSGSWSDSVTSTAPTPTSTTGGTGSSTSPAPLNGTVEVQPQSTYPTAVSVTTTNAQGQITVTAPPVITVTGTTMENGLPVTYTSEVANPSSQSQQLSTSHSFFNNRGAVAGVFVVVGLVLASILVCICLSLSRRRRQFQQETRNRVSWPVHDHKDGPFNSPTSPMDFEGGRPSMHQSLFDGVGMASVPNRSMATTYDNAGPFSDYHTIQRAPAPEQGFAYDDERTSSPYPSVNTSPSMYLADLPQFDGPVETAESEESVLPADRRSSSPVEVPVLRANPPPHPPRLMRPPSDDTAMRASFASSSVTEPSSPSSPRAPPTVVFRPPTAPAQLRNTFVDEPKRALSRLSEEYRPLTPPTSISERSFEDDNPFSDAAATVNVPPSAAAVPAKRTLINIRPVSGR